MALDRWILAGERNIAAFLLKALLPHTSIPRERHTILLHYGKKETWDDGGALWQATSPFLPRTLELVFPERAEDFDFFAEEWPYDRTGRNCRFCICNGAPFLEQSIRNLVMEAKNDGFHQWPVMFLLADFHLQAASTDVAEEKTPLAYAMDVLEDQEMPFACFSTIADARALFFRLDAGKRAFFGFSYVRYQIRTELARMERWCSCAAEEDFKHIRDVWEEGPTGCLFSKALDRISSYDGLAERKESTLWQRAKSAGWEQLAKKRGSAGFQGLTDCLLDRIAWLPEPWQDAYEKRFWKRLRAAYVSALAEPERFSASWDAMGISNDTDFMKSTQEESSQWYGITGRFRKAYQQFVEERSFPLLKEEICKIHDELVQRERRSRV